MLDTFNALLRIGQIEAGARRAAFRPLDLAEVAREVAEAFAPAAEDEGKTLVTRLDVLLPLAGDKEPAQMIANLIDNALGHTPAGVRTGRRRADRGGDRIIGLRQRSWRCARGREAIFSVFIELARRTALPEPASVSRWSAIAELHGLDCRASDNGPGLCVTAATAVEEE